MGSEGGGSGIGRGKERMEGDSKVLKAVAFALDC